MTPIPCFKQDRRPETVLTDGFATAGRGKYPVRDAIFSVGARNESRVLSLMSALRVNAGTPASPMRMLSRCSEHPLNVPIDSPHRADARVDQQVAAFGGADQAIPRYPAKPLRQACDAVAGIAQSHQLAPTRQQDRIIERAGQAAAGLDRAISYLRSGMCCVLDWRSFPPLRLPHSPSRLLCFPEPLTEFV
jgi:hypothetical protein